MKLSYDAWQDLWYQNETSDRISFGANQVPLSKTLGKESFTVNVTVKDGKAGPLIGIMASLTSKGAVIGNAPLFRALQREAISRKGFTIVFPPEGINNGHISGFMFILEKQTWFPVVTPLPDVVYNRVPLRGTEESAAFTKAVELFNEWNIPFFNPSFIDKSSLYQLLSGNRFFDSIMPETIKVTERQPLKEFLNKHNGIYLKPALSSRGSGIFLLRQEEDGHVRLKSHKQKQIYPSFNRFWEENSKKFLNRRYIAQAEVIPHLLDGKRYDFRIHVHDSLEGYQITGIGVRQSQKQNLTTHIPNGGKLIPYERVHSKKHDRFFSKLVSEVGQLLSKELGYFGEFSIDAGITSTGQYVLYEVNSKPMEFDEETIEKQRVYNIIELLFQKAGF